MGKMKKIIPNIIVAMMRGEDRAFKHPRSAIVSMNCTPLRAIRDYMKTKDLSKGKKHNF